MSVKMEVLEKNVVELEISVVAEEYAKEINQTAKRLGQKINVPGFRKGKAPRQIVEAQIGKKSLLEEAAESLVSHAFASAISEKDIEPVDYPNITLVQTEDGKDLIFKAKVTIKPEVILGEYKGLKVEKGTPVVTDEKVEEEMKSKQEQHAKVITLEEGTVQADDIANIDFEGFLDGVAFAGGKGENHDLKIGSNTFIPGFEDQVIGIAVGQEADIHVVFPEVYHSEELAGKPVVFKVKVNKIKRKELNPLDDEFAKDVSEFDTLEALKADIREKLERVEAQRVENEYIGNIMAKVIDNASVEIPDVMINSRIDLMVKEFEQMLQYQGFTKEQYLQHTKMSEQTLREELRPKAAERVKEDIVLEKIAKTEGIELTEEELRAEIAQTAELYKQDMDVFLDALHTHGQLEHYRNELRKDKTMKYLAEQNA